MNTDRRKKLRDVIAMLQRIQDVVDSVCDTEQDCVDNYPENLQMTDRYESMENAVDALNEAIDNLSSAQECILAAIS